jgi:hypothetical protein
MSSRVVTSRGHRYWFDARGLRELVGDGQEELAKQERCSRRCDERQRESRVRVDHAELRDNLVRRQDAHLDGQHQRDEDHPEERSSQREAEIDDRKRGQKRDRDLADRDAERHDQAVPHHLPDRRLRSRGAAAREHCLVVLDQVRARRHLHRHARHLAERQRRADEGHVERQRDDRHTRDQHEMAHDHAERTALYHVSPAGPRQETDAPARGAASEASVGVVSSQ